MPTEMVRRHIILPRELAEKFAELVGERKQSEEIAAMIAARVRAEERRKFFVENAGFAAAEDYPHWATNEDIVEWVRTLRRDGWERPEVRQWQEEQQRGDPPG